MLLDCSKFVVQFCYVNARVPVQISVTAVCENFCTISGSYSVENVNMIYRSLMN